MPQGISLSASMLVGNNNPIDAKYGPYGSLAAALADIPTSMRYQGLTVGINAADGMKEYWFKDGVADTHFVDKATLVPDISGTYWYIRSLAETSQLIPGKYYRISDYRTAWWDYTLNGYKGAPIPAGNILAVQSNGFFVSPSGASDPMNGLQIRSNRFVIMEMGDTDWEALGAAAWGKYPGGEFGWNGSAPKFNNNASTGTHGKLVPCILSQELVSSVTEPLIVLAIGVKTFQSVAHSELYPGDSIEYNFWETKSWSRPGYGFAGLTNAKGWITRRKGVVWGGAVKRGTNNVPILDSKNNYINDPVASQGMYNQGTLECPYDWRHITWPCRKPDLSKIETWSSTKGYNKNDFVKLNNVVYACVTSYSSGAGSGPPVDANGNLIAGGNGSVSGHWLPVYVGEVYVPVFHGELDNGSYGGRSVMVPGKHPHLMPNTEEPWSFWGQGNGSGTPKYTQFYGMTRMSYNPSIYFFNGVSMFIPWDFTTRAQKMTLSSNPDTAESNFIDWSMGGGSRIFGYGNVLYGQFRDSNLGSETEGGCHFNVLWSGGQNIKTGANFGANMLGWIENTQFGANCYNNKLLFLRNVKIGDNAVGNELTLENSTAGNSLAYNLLGGGCNFLSLGNSFIQNLAMYQFSNNTFVDGNIGNVFGWNSRGNTWGSSNYNNDIYQSFGCTFRGVQNLQTYGTLNLSDFNGVQNCRLGGGANNAVVDAWNLYITGSFEHNELRQVFYLEGNNWQYNKLSAQIRVVTRNQYGVNFYRNEITDPWFFGSWSVDGNFTNASLCYTAIKKTYSLLTNGQGCVSYVKPLGSGSTPADCAYVTEGLRNSSGNWDRYNFIN